MPSTAQIWERSRSRPASRGAGAYGRVLTTASSAPAARYAKKAPRIVCLRSRLRASARAKPAAISLAQLGPACGRRSRAETTQQPRPIPRRAGARTCRQPRRQRFRRAMRQQFLDGAIGAIGFAARQPVGQAHAVRRDRRPARATIAPGSTRYSSTPPASASSSARPMLPAGQRDQSGGLRRGRSGR